MAKAPVVAVAVPKELTPSAQVAHWIRADMKGATEVKLPDLAQRTVAHFRTDTAFLDQFLQESLTPLVYDIARRVAASTRDMIVLGDVVVTKGSITERAKRVSARWDSWLEHVNDRHIRLRDMTRADLRAAISERRKRGDVEYAIASLFEAMVERMASDDAVVRDVFSNDDIELLRAKLPATISSDEDMEVAA